MSHKIIIPNTHPHNKRLSDSINTFAGKHDVKRVFLSYSNTSQKHFLIIHIKDIHVPEEVLKNKWIRKTLEQFDTHIVIMGEQNIRAHVRFGTLFINRHCNASTLIYKKQDHEPTYPELSEQLKKFRQFKEDYYNTHDLLSTEIRKTKNADFFNSLAMAYHSYLSLFEHHIHFLEILCIGEYFPKSSISQRILRLEGFVPEIKTLMLKKTDTTYFIIEALNSAGSDEQKDEFEEAIIDTEQKFYYLVDRIFRETKKAVKKPEQKPILIENKTVSPYEPVITILTKNFRIREIFLFHQEEKSSENKKTTVLYLLLISSKINNDTLFNIVQMVSKQTEGRFNVVPIAHSGAWIQEYLWEYQEFFKKVMIPENSIFRVDVPTVTHWYKDDYFSDLDTCEMQYRECKELYEKYQLLRSQEELKSNEGMGLILSALFYRICAVFPYVTLAYRPNNINIYILWKLCEYADPKVKNFTYLIQKLPFDFFEFINPHKNLYRNFHHLQEEHLTIIDELAQGFLSLVDKQFK